MEENRSAIAQIIDFISESFRLFTKYFFSRLIISFIIGTVCFFVLWIIGIKLKLLISLIVAAATLVPYFGPITAILITALITVFQAPVFALWMTIVNLVLQFLDAWVLSPLIMGKSLRLHPAVIIAAILIGGSVFGILGLIFAVPAAAVTGLLIRKIRKTDNKA